MPTNPALTRTVTVERTFEAPRELVFQAFTQPQHLRRWWGPKGYTSPVCEADVRVGGRYLFCMRSPEGQDIYSTGTFREVVANERLVYTDSFADKRGNVVTGAFYGLPDDFPLELLVTITFAEAPGGRTRVVLEHARLPAGEMADGAGIGWAESLDKVPAALAGRNPLMVLLPAEREIQLVRVVDAPRELVFKIYTDPQSIPHWWGPRSVTTSVDQMDVRPGGRWRYVQRNPDGSQTGFRGEYREIAPPDRLVATFEWEGMPGHISLETTRFEEHGGGTRIVATTQFDSVDDRDGMLQYGMEEGAAELWDRLEEHARTLMPAP
jgi:uncharacterized protein YndB with AHSA1/START domain